MSPERHKVVLVLSAHHHDRVYGENLREFLRGQGYRLEFLLIEDPDYAEKILTYLQKPDTAALISLAYYGFKPREHGLTFDKIAKHTDLPVIAWLMDHPTFYISHVPCSDPSFAVMMICQDHVDYWHNYVNPQSDLFWCMNVGAHKRTQLPEFSAERYRKRPLFAFAPINFKRADSFENFMEDLGRTDSTMQDFVNEIGEAGRVRLDTSIHELCLEALLQRDYAVETPMLHYLAAMVDQYVNLVRRRQLHSDMLNYPVVIDGGNQPDISVENVVATCIDRQDTRATLTDITRSKIVISLSNTHDYIHDRTLNAMAAGAVPLVERNSAHLAWFEEGVDCFMFDYDRTPIGQVLGKLHAEPDRLVDVAANAYAKFRNSDLQYYKFENLIHYIEKRIAALPESSNGALAV